MEQLDASYWDHRYKTGNIGWDLGTISPPLKMYIDQLHDKSIKILIPGGGNAYEAEYLFNNGFTNVFVVDLSRTALNAIKKRIPHFPSKQLLCQDFFNVNQTFDLILEQTFFCALNPKLRSKYVSKMYDLLSNEGKLVGLLFNIPLYQDHPPFGGSLSEYQERFGTLFEILIMEKATNSHSSRTDKELFFMLKKK